MNDDLWGEEPFNDMPDEAQLDDNGQLRQSPPAALQRPVTPNPNGAKQIKEARKTPPQISDEFIEELVEAVDQEDADEDFSEVLVDANLRLEQGNLWKMIMKHDLFEGLDADPKAIQNVQKIIRKFAKEQMEEMLGMRQKTAQVETLHIDFPFNAVEVEVLKMLAHKASGGRSEESDNYVPIVTKTTEEVPVVHEVKRKTLNTIGPSHKKTQPVANKPLPKQPKAPVKRTRLDATIDRIAREEGVPRELLEEDLAGIGGKPLHEMTEEEILERNRIASKRRQVQVKSTDALPMPSYEMQEALATTLAAKASSSYLKGLIEAAKTMPPTKTS